MRRGPVLAAVLLAFGACGGRADLSLEEDGSSGEDGSDLRDATSDAIATRDSTTDTPNLLGDSGADADATLPPELDGSAPLDGGPIFYDAPFFPDALCGPATCKFGCCSGIGECIEPTTNAACGWYGVACEPCGDGGTCNGGFCTYTLWTCGPSNCAGCCIGMQSFGDAAQTGCFPGTDSEFCGSAGSGCTICKSGSTCRPLLFDAGGFCQENSNTCDPTNCTGCCINGVCAQGDQAIACGIGGVACQDCGDGGACGNGNCKCGPPYFPPCTND